MIATSYHIRRISRLLKQGKAWIDGRCADPGPWPYGDIYWIVQDGTRQETYHVLESERPSWYKYTVGISEE